MKKDAIEERAEKDLRFAIRCANLPGAEHVILRLLDRIEALETRLAAWDQHVEPITITQPIGNCDGSGWVRRPDMKRGTHPCPGCRACK